MEPLLNTAGLAPAPVTASSRGDRPDSPPGQKKRNRIRFSCTTCRDKKLRCDRASPCDQCLKRGLEASCRYVPYERPRSPGRAQAAAGASSSSSSVPAPPSQNALQRLRHLERLVHVLKARRGADAEDVFPTSSGGEWQGEAEAPGVAAAQSDAGPDMAQQQPTAGPLVGDDRYVNAANWEAVLEEITKLTDEIQIQDDEESDPPREADDDFTPDDSGPLLLVGGFHAASTADLVACLPPRPTTDRLVGRFFQAKEPAWMMFHVPTFLRQYEDFWRDPTAASTTYVGLLFMMASYAALFCLRGDEEVPGGLGPPRQVCDEYRARAAQCLALDDYTRPGRYKVELMLLYFGIEFLRRHDASLGTSVLLAITVRLAMHTGLHRDPRHHAATVGPWEGEMRRRLWTVLFEVDQLVSHQLGLPANAQLRYCDTDPPRNLHDEDFGPDAPELPPSRPESERTPTLYTIAKSRLIRAFARVLEAVASQAAVPHAAVCALDDELEAARAAVPPLLRPRPFAASAADPFDLVMQRSWLELLYLKARMVLHRRHLGPGRRDARLARSRAACLDAAARVLRHQLEWHLELQPGGRLSKERWAVSSASSHDFLLAGMILCLELSYLLQTRRDEGRAGRDGATSLGEVIPTDRLLDILRTSRQIWDTQRKQSAEATRAFKIMSRMLSLATGSEYDSGSSPESATAGAVLAANVASELKFPQPSVSPASGQTETPPPQPSILMGAAPKWDPSMMMPSSLEAPAFVNPPIFDVGVGVGVGADPGSFSASDGLHNFFGPTDETDWTMWDSSIQNPGPENMQIPWGSFFQQPPGWRTE